MKRSQKTDTPALQAHRDDYAKHREARLAYQKEYTKKHLEEIKVKHKEWRAENHETQLAHQRRYVEEHKEASDAYQKAYRLRKKEAQ